MGELSRNDTHRANMSMRNVVAGVSTSPGCRFIGRAAAQPACVYSAGSGTRDLQPVQFTNFVFVPYPED